MRRFYMSGFEVMVGDTVLYCNLNHSSSFQHDLYKVISIDSFGNVIYAFANEVDSSTIPSNPCEHEFLVSRRGSSEILLGKYEPKRNYDSATNTYYYCDGNQVKLGDRVLIKDTNNSLECTIAAFVPINYKLWQGGGIIIDPIDNEIDYFFYPYITEDILFLRRRD